MKSYMTREQANAWVTSLADRNGMAVDEHVRPLVAALARLGVYTTMSCHGHESFEYPCPWVRFTYRDLQFVAKLVARQNGSCKKNGDMSVNLWVLYPSADQITLAPFNLKQPLAKLRADACTFAEFLHELADRG